MELAVLGGGNGSLAAALDLTEQGHTVRLWRRDPETVAGMNADARTMVLKDIQGSRPVQIHTVTADLGEAIADVPLIVCPTPAIAQSDIAARLGPLLADGQVVFMPPGSFGTYIMAEAMRDCGNTANASFVEAGTLPYLTRRHGNDTVAITTRATRLPSGVLPHRNSKHSLEVVRRAYPSVEDAGDALSGALMNAGPIIHPPLILMNAGPIEHFEHWDIHNEGTQPSIRRVTTALDAERIAVRETLGYGPPHFPLADHYDNEADEWMYGNAAHEKLTDSGDWRENLVLTEHRYMFEDVKIGLSLLVSVADWSKVAAPVATGLLSIASAVCAEDFRQSGRTLENLGLDHLDRRAMAELLETGP
ncbi:MAG: NAD/NADP octopine/nopaline dehydrogenase family protein [Pseudomonadota bacterium]